jgi:hypothetical protein
VIDLIIRVGTVRISGDMLDANPSGVVRGTPMTFETYVRTTVEVLQQMEIAATRCPLARERPLVETSQN